MKIWVNGCFDILHNGHLNLLEFASKKGELHVGIDSDLRIKELKGADRPINSQDFRFRILRSLSFVKAVYVFNNEQELINYISTVNPNYIVIGEDYRNKKIVGSTNRNIIFFPHTKGLSTSNTIHKIKNNLSV